MKKRPLSVAIVGCLLIAAGAIGLVYHAKEFLGPKPFEAAWISFVRVLAIVSGIFVLQGKNWARWLALAWIAFHVAISFYHSWQQAVFHALVLVAFAYCLFHPAARAFFD